MNKHKHSDTRGGFHIAQMIPFEVVGYSTVAYLWPRVGFIWASVVACFAIYVSYKLFVATRAVARNIPTALGYSDVAVASGKKVADKAKIQSQPKTLTATV